MKYLASLIVTLTFVCLSSATVAAQAGRRRSTDQPKASYPVPLPDVSTTTASTGQIKQDSQDKTIYQCVLAGQATDETSAAANEEIFSAKDVTTKAQILAKPDPAYSLEARRNGTAGTVVLRVLLSSSARVTSIKVLKELPDGLTESAVKAACQIRFKPAMKDNRAVAQYVMVKYGFMVDMRIGARSRRPPLSPRP